MISLIIPSKLLISLSLKGLKLIVTVTRKYYVDIFIFSSCKIVLIDAPINQVIITLISIFLMQSKQRRKNSITA